MARFSLFHTVSDYAERARRAALLVQDGYALEMLTRLGRKLSPEEPPPEAMLDPEFYEAWAKKHRTKASQAQLPMAVIAMSRGQSAAKLNLAVRQASADWIVFVEEGTALTAEALDLLGKAAATSPEALLYADHDYRFRGLFAPCLKPDFSPLRLLHQPYIATPVALSRQLFTDLGRFRAQAHGALLYDLVLRASLVAPVVHVPSVLCHRPTQRHAWPTLGEPSQAQRRVVASALRRLHLRATVTLGRLPGTLRIRPRIPARTQVSIIVPFRDRAELLDACLGSLAKHTRFSRYDVILVDNGSREQKTELSLARWRRELSARVLTIPGPFNFADLNNRAARTAKGDQLLLLNNDTEIIDGDWLTAMLEWSVQPDIGAVGPMLLYPDRTVQHAGLLLGVGGAVSPAFLGAREAAPGYFGALQVVREVSAVTGACLMVGREKFWRAGGLDQDRYRVIYNDVSLCLQLATLGLRTIYTPYARLIHHESKSRGDAIHAAEDREFFRHYHDQLGRDPYYHPLLSKRATDFRLGR